MVPGKLVEQQIYQLFMSKTEELNNETVQVRDSKDVSVSKQKSK